jgi:oligoendopeptidase F
METITHELGHSFGNTVRGFSYFMRMPNPVYVGWQLSEVDRP